MIARRSESNLPPGPRVPKTMQTIGWWARPTAYLERCRERYGKRFTIRMLAQDPFVLISDPDEIKQVFTAPADVLYPGEGARILEPIVGPNSILLLDEKAHMGQKRLVLPAFHGERMQRLESVITEVTREQIASWPRDQVEPMHPRMQALTMEVILAAVFGLRSGPRLDALRLALTEMLEFGLSPLSLLPPAQRAPWGLGPWAGFVRARARADELIYAEIRERRDRQDDGGSEIITSLLAAEHEDGSPMSDEEIHDELLTLLVAGHETTATELAWALERLTREPEVLARLVAEIDEGDGEPYLTAVIRETLRRRPVLTQAQPRTVKKPIEVGGITYRQRVHLVASAWLVHHDPDIYPDPYAFRPERFLDSEPGTYTWIPFGGGRRRCIGANFAMLEMAIVLRELLRETRIRAGHAGPEFTIRRAITVTPGHGAETVLTDRAA
ncbi:MAG: cytochrome P450 [Thermoleophilia bacterium]|nr:cytochrome P450 [Thermoleophilia bacterium]